MTCGEIQAIVDSWAMTGTVTAGKYRLFSEHLGTCRSCRVRYAAILPLIQRDLGVPGSVLREDFQPEPGFVSGVMERISQRRAPIVHRLRDRRAPLTLRVGAAAAAVVFLLVIGVGYLTLHSRADNRTVVVHFVLDAPGARSVALVGNFVAWNPDKLFLKRQAGSTRWEISIPLKRGETYLYNFVINGQTWIPDPSTEVQVNDGFGGRSSLMQL